MKKLTCDFCGRELPNKEIIRTHYGTSGGYVRLMCKECQKETNADEIKRD